MNQWDKCYWPRPPPHQMKRWAPGERGGPQRWKVFYIQPPGQKGAATAPHRLDTVDSERWNIACHKEEELLFHLCVDKLGEFIKNWVNFGPERSSWLINGCQSQSCSSDFSLNHNPFSTRLGMCSNYIKQFYASEWSKRTKDLDQSCQTLACSAARPIHNHY